MFRAPSVLGPAHGEHGAETQRARLDANDGVPADLAPVTGVPSGGVDVRGAVAPPGVEFLPGHPAPAEQRPPVELAKVTRMLRAFSE